MKCVYRIVLAVLCAVALLSFLPWLFDIAFPSEDSEPFVAWSPVCESFVVSVNGDKPSIFTVDANGNTVVTGLTKNDRDSLVPQMYFNQLISKKRLPDTIAGRAVDVPILKNSQWVFNSLPRDINKVDARVYPVMESRPKRVDLEDPTEVVTLDDGIRFIDMATNSENTPRSKRFGKVFADKGFAFPAICANADITAKKAYDEGYLIIDSQNKLYHFKMQAGQPYLAQIALPGATPTHAFILENPDQQHIGLVTTSDGSLYAIERDGYTPVKLPLSCVDAKKQRITIMKNLFTWVIRVSDNNATTWTAIDSDSYALLGTYTVTKSVSKAQAVARWIFPFRISFTSINDCYAYPRVSDFSLPACIIWIVLITAIIFIINKKHKNENCQSFYHRDDSCFGLQLL